MQRAHPIIHIGHDNDEVKSQVKVFLEEKLRYLLSQHGTVNIGVSGGSMPALFCAAMLSIENLEWRRIRIFMVDERYVPHDDPESNYGQYISLLPQELHECVIPVPLCESITKTALAYEMILRRQLMPEQSGSYARFDILLLGVGPDGHTCSLFPGNERLPKLTDFNWISFVSDSPKPPPRRVTLTINVLQYAKNTAFIMTGAQKAPIVKAMVLGDTHLPASQVRPMNEKLWYFIDEAAAAEIPEICQSLQRDDSSRSSPSPSPIEE